jgi:hypothetical protein
VVSIATGRPITAKTVHPLNSYLARVEVTRWVSAANAFQPWSETRAQVLFALDAAGTQPITGLAGLEMTELGDVPGTYAVVIPGPTMSALVPYVGQTVYQITRVGLTLQDGDVVTPLVVRFPRYAQ